MGLLSTIIFFQGKFINTEVFNFLLISNPTDAFRIFNLTGFDSVSALSGMNTVASKINLPLYAPVGIIILWIIFPLVIAMEIFEKKEL
jgi:Cu-processing system permease protein